LLLGSTLPDYRIAHTFTAVGAVYGEDYGRI
jgi:hypothetical protein